MIYSGIFASSLSEVDGTELVNHLYEGGIMFELTGEGKRYLNGELDAAKHLQRPAPHSV